MCGAHPSFAWLSRLQGAALLLHERAPASHKSVWACLCAQQLQQHNPIQAALMLLVALVDLWGALQDAYAGFCVCNCELRRGCAVKQELGVQSKANLAIAGQREVQQQLLLLLLLLLPAAPLANAVRPSSAAPA